jgi:hypothetical protein
MLESAGRPSSEGRGTDKAGESCHCCCCVLVVVERLSGHGKLQGTRNVTSARKSPRRGSLTNYFGFTASSRNPSTTQHSTARWDTQHTACWDASPRTDKRCCETSSPLSLSTNPSAPHTPRRKKRSGSPRNASLWQKRTLRPRGTVRRRSYMYGTPPPSPPLRTREPPNKEALLPGGREILPRTAQNT